MDPGSMRKAFWALHKIHSQFQRFFQLKQFNGQFQRSQALGSMYTEIMFNVGPSENPLLTGTILAIQISVSWA
jgi:hypothetical protein